MSDQLQAQLAEYLKAILTTAQQGAAFVKEQAPMVVQEKILYARVLFTVEAVAFAIAALVLARLAVRFYKIASEAGKGYRCDIWPERPGGLLNIACSIGSIGSALFAVIAAETAVQAWFAPRLYILEWAMSLVKQ